jgi:Zn-dependent M28 family amino/carboxypeptidase
MRRMLGLLLVLQVTLGAQSAAPRHVDRPQLMRDLAALSDPALEGRRTGTPGGAKARAWIVEQFRAAGLTPAGVNGYLQPFTFSTTDSGALLPGGRPFRTEYSGANVIGRLAGREPDSRVLLVIAHYDHLGIRDGVLYPGADDNASGVVGLLAAARYFRNNPPRHPMMFAALDGEELGQRGAHALLGSALIDRRATAMVVNLDMVSKNDRGEIYAAGTSVSPWLVPILMGVQTRVAVRILFGHDRPGSPGGLDDWTHSSDHGPFHDAGVAWLYFGVEDHPDYHKPTDTADRVDPTSFGNTIDMVIETLVALDAAVD